MISKEFLDPRYMDRALKICKTLLGRKVLKRKRGQATLGSETRKVGGARVRRQQRRVDPPLGEITNDRAEN